MIPKIDENESIDLYVSQINQFKLLDRQAEFQLAQRYVQTKDRQAFDQLVNANLRFVVKIAHEYRGYSLRLQDLVQEGNIGLLHAVEKFDPQKGYRLISYAVWWIRAYIQNFILRSWSLVKIGTTQAQRRLFFKLRSAREQAERKLKAMESVSTQDLAKRLQVAEEEVIQMEMRLSARDFSLDAHMDENGKQTHLDMLASGAIAPEQQVAQAEERALVRGQVKEAMGVLNPKERYIVENRLMADEPMTLQQIGEHFQISRERARQIEGNVIRKLRGFLSGFGLSTEGGRA